MKIGKKNPTQSRSKELVNSILEATAQVVESSGLNSFSTNKVAQKAGVSIGSLYQYFLNRESILDSFFDDMMKKNTAFYSQIFTDHPNVSLETLLEKMVDLLFAHFIKQKGYLTTLHSMQTMLKKSDSIVKFRMRLSEITAAEFHRRFPELGTEEEIKKKVFLILCQNFGILHMYIHTQNSPYSKEELHEAMVSSALRTLRAAPSRHTSVESSVVAH